MLIRISALTLGDICRAYAHDVMAAILLLRNNETEDMFVSQSNPVEVELFSYVNTFVGFMLHNFRTEI